MACANCRQWALRSFITALGGPSVPRGFPSVVMASRRHLASSTQSRSPRSTSQRVPESDLPLNDINDEFSKPVLGHTFAPRPKAIPDHAIRETRPASEPGRSQPDPLSHQTANRSEDALTEPATQDTPQDTPTGTVAHIPWYLQSSLTPESRPKELSTSQQIPALPEHPPPILQSLLQHVSVELGIDDLTLLDLRALDPPPALGANLVMIIGTARSEKHLHVTADKLCRWLRTEHRLSPYADGLLGRNELKLKLRRQAKRSRLLKSVGSKVTADTDLEEGIRTGWVCVNMGRVEGGELPKTAVQLERESNIVGFSSESGGSRIVIQLLTEEKRAEIGLERLWNGVLKKSARDAGVLDEEHDVLEEGGAAS